MSIESAAVVATKLTKFPSRLGGALVFVDRRGAGGVTGLLLAAGDSDLEGEASLGEGVEPGE